MKRIVFHKIQPPHRASLGLWLACCSLGVLMDGAPAGAVNHAGVAGSSAITATTQGKSQDKVEWSAMPPQAAGMGGASGMGVDSRAVSPVGATEATRGGAGLQPAVYPARPMTKQEVKQEAKKRSKAPWSHVTPSQKQVMMITTLEQALSAAYSFNLDIVNAFAELKKAQEQCFVNRAEWLPTVDLTGSVGVSRARNEIHSNVGTVENVVMRSYHQKELMKNMRGNLQLAYNLYQGGSTKARNEKAFEDYRTTYWAFIDRIQNVLQTTVATFVNLAKAQELYLLAKTREKSLNAEAIITAKRAVSGDKRTVDASLARANAIQKTLEVNSAYQGYLEAKGKLEMLTGCPVSSEIVFPKPLKLPMWDQAKFKKVALVKYPGIQAAMCRQKSAQYTVREIKGSLAPKLDVTCNFGVGDDWTYDVNQGLDPYPDLRNQLNKGVNFNVTFPLFDGGRRQAQTRQAELGVKQARYGVEVAKRQLLANIDNVFLAYQNAEQDIQSALEAQKEHGAVFGAAREEYELGATSLLDLIALEEQYTRMAQLVVNAYGNIVLYSYSVVELLGRLHPDYLHTMSVSTKYDITQYRQEYTVKMLALGQDESKTPLYPGKVPQDTVVGSPAMIQQPLIDPPSNTTLHVGWYPEHFSLGATEASPPLDQEMQQWLDDFNAQSPWDAVSNVVKQEAEEEDNKELYQALQSLNAGSGADAQRATNANNGRRSADGGFVKGIGKERNGGRGIAQGSGIDGIRGSGRDGAQDVVIKPPLPLQPANEDISSEAPSSAAQEQPQ